MDQQVHPERKEQGQPRIITAGKGRTGRYRHQQNQFFGSHGGKPQGGDPVEMQETELNGAGPDIPDEALHQLEEKLDGLTENDVLILAGSIPASLPQDVYQRLLARLDGQGVRCVVDATRALLVNVLPYHPFLIKPNNHELGEIVGRELHTDEEIAAAARTLQEKGARNVLVSMAGDGALLLDEEGQTHRIGCPKGKVVNSVGAGDSMVAGFVAGYLQSGSYAQALRLGTACGSATAFSLGLATKEKIDELLVQL